MLKPTKGRQRFSLRSLFVFAAIIAVALTIQQTQHDWYARTYSSHHVWSLLGNQIRNGDSKEDVARYFDIVRPLNELEMATFRQILDSQPGAGMQRGDEYLAFGLKNGSWAWLQLRNNQVVNHRASSYADLALLAQMNGMHHPSWVARHPSFTAAMSFALLCVASWALSQTVLRRWILRVAFLGVTGTSLVYLCSAGDWCFALACVGWGILYGAGWTLHGDSIRLTSQTPARTMLFYAAFFLIISVHAVLATVSTGVLGFLCAGWMIIAAAALARRTVAERRERRCIAGPGIPSAIHEAVV